MKLQIQMLADRHVVIDPTVSWNELRGCSLQTSLTAFYRDLPKHFGLVVPGTAAFETLAIQVRLIARTK